MHRVKYRDSSLMEVHRKFFPNAYLISLTQPEDLRPCCVEVSMSVAGSCGASPRPLTRVGRALYRAFLPLAATLDAAPVLRATLGATAASSPVALAALTPIFSGPGRELPSALAALRAAFRSPDASESVALRALPEVASAVAAARAAAKYPAPLAPLRTAMARFASPATSATVHSTASAAGDSKSPFPALTPGTLLLAAPTVSGRFSRAIVLLLEHDDARGSLGVVVNADSVGGAKHMTNSRERVGGVEQRNVFNESDSVFAAWASEARARSREDNVDGALIRACTIARKTPPRAIVPVAGGSEKGFLNSPAGVDWAAIEYDAEGALGYPAGTLARAGARAAARASGVERDMGSTGQARPGGGGRAAVARALGRASAAGLSSRYIAALPAPLLTGAGLDAPASARLRAAQDSFDPLLWRGLFSTQKNGGTRAVSTARTPAPALSQKSFNDAVARARARVTGAGRRAVVGMQRYAARRSALLFGSLRPPALCGVTFSDYVGGGAAWARRTRARIVFDVTPAATADVSLFLGGGTPIFVSFSRVGAKN